MPPRQRYSNCLRAWVSLHPSTRKGVRLRPLGFRQPEIPAGVTVFARAHPVLLNRDWLPLGKGWHGALGVPAEVEPVRLPCLVQDVPGGLLSAARELDAFDRGEEQGEVAVHTRR